MGDVAEGSEIFPIFPVLLAARWIHFASVFILFGAAFFWLFLRGDYPRARWDTDILLRGAAPVATLSGLSWLAAIVANMAGGFDKVLDGAILQSFFFQTQFGPVVALRLVLLAAIVIAALAPLRAQTRSLVLGGAGGALLINQAWLGHAAEGEGLWGAVMVAVYSLHVLAAAAWVGGLPPLLFVLRELSDWPKRETREAAAVLSSYSMMATLAVASIAVTGIANADFHHLVAPGLVLETPYGRTLAVKLVLVVLMLAFAAFNRLVATPALRAEDDSMPGRLRASVAAETAVGLLVLAAAAYLGVTPPP